MANYGEDLTKHPPGSFGRIVPKKREGSYHWCECTCKPIGERQAFLVRNDHLKSGNTRSCGCLRVEAGRSLKQPKAKVA